MIMGLWHVAHYGQYALILATVTGLLVFKIRIRTFSKWTGANCWWPRPRAICCALWMNPRARSVYFSIFKATLLLPRRPARMGTGSVARSVGVRNARHAARFPDFKEDIGRVRQGKRGAGTPLCDVVIRFGRRASPL